MSKIVCDVCGTPYSETEAQCPICGTAKPETAKPVVEANGEEQAAKGGKFSRTNNRKSGAGNTRKPARERNNSGSEEGAPSNLSMIIIVTVLLLAIVAVCVFIAVRLIGGTPDEPDTTGSTNAPSQSTALTIPCTGIELVGNDGTLLFTDLPQTAQLTVKAIPENTTDSVVYTYTSSDPSVATVDQTGLVTPVASGTATITIAYGSYSLTVNVTCDIPAPITELKLTASEITFNPNNGWSWKLYDGELDPADIVWTSSDEAVAYVENGVVTAVGNGNATITAAYGELSATCKIIVRNMNVETGYTLSTNWSIANDATMNVGEKIEIFLVNKQNGQPVTGLTWEPSNDFKGGCASFVATDRGIEVTALKTTADVSGQYVYIQTVYEGVQYRFIIRIKAPATQE